MRILHLLHDFLPRHVAGVEVYVDRISREQARAHEVALLYAESRSERENYSLTRGRRGKVQTFEVVNNARYRNLEETYLNPRIEARAQQVLDEFEPDVVHVHHLLNLSVGIAQELRRRGIATAMTLHDHWLVCANGGQRFHRELGRCEQLDASRCGSCTARLHGVPSVARRWSKRLASRAPGGVDRSLRLGAQLFASHRDARAAEQIRARWDTMRSLGNQIGCFLAPSHSLLEEACEFGIPRDRIRFCDQGAAADPKAPRRDLPECARTFAFIGSPVRHKGLHRLIEAFGRLPADARLRIVGSLDYDPPYSAELRHLAQHPGISFLGGLPPERIPDFLKEVDCLVVPSVWLENAPIAIREAWLAGIPVIASDLGGNCEALAQGGGLLYSADHSDALAKQLERLYGEPGLAAALVASAPRVPRLGEHVRELVDLYRTLIDLQPPLGAQDA